MTREELASETLERFPWLDDVTWEPNRGPNGGWTLTVGNKSEFVPAYAVSIPNAITSAAYRLKGPA
jgi:hypothetical protein